MEGRLSAYKMVDILKADEAKVPFAFLSLLVTGKSVYALLIN
jgi:hypothetical protein